jgi:outer membrane immunogenic protein
MKYRVVFATPLGLLPAAAIDTAHAAPPTPSPFSWTGFYVGANLGALSQQSKLDAFLPSVAGSVNYCFTNDCTFRDKETATGVLGGLQIGYNFTNAAWLYGIEFDIGLSSAQKKHSNNAANGYDYNSKTGVDAFGTLRGRLGYIFAPNAMIYATGGLAFAKTRDATQATDNIGGNTYSWEKTNWRAGWTLGGGVEYMLSRNISIKGEALYYDLGDEKMVSTSAAGPSAVGVRDRMDGVIARIGINYFFH